MVFYQDVRTGIGLPEEEHGLRGARIGVARQFFDFQPGAKKIIEAALEVLKGYGTSSTQVAANPR